jgi:hypothetical protein
MNVVTDLRFPKIPNEWDLENHTTREGGILTALTGTGGASDPEQGVRHLSVDTRAAMSLSTSTRNQSKTHDEPLPHRSRVRNGYMLVVYASETGVTVTPRNSTV